jgi:N-acetylglucosamine kinase-like BadF-type ATPase
MLGRSEDLIVRYVLGLDAGGTKTVCLLADESGAVLSEARAPGANLQAVGELEVEKILHQVMDEAIGDRAVLPQAICLGIAGVDREADQSIIRAIMRRIGYKARAVIVNDALVALVAGAGRDPGIVIIAGTGSIAYGANADGRAARAGGWGYVLGDEGSGYWMGRRALRAVVRQADARGEETLLTGRLLQHFGIAKPQDLVQIVYYRNLRPPAIAALATHVSQAAAEGDAVAREILSKGADELVGIAGSVMMRLRLREDAFTFVLAGGIFQAVPWLRDELKERLTALAPRSHVERLAVEPAMGAVQLAVAELQGGARIPTYL